MGYDSEDHRQRIYGCISGKKMYVAFSLLTWGQVREGGQELLVRLLWGVAELLQSVSHGLVTVVHN